jgi:outer membrane biosynthesis protein TonB
MLSNDNSFEAFLQKPHGDKQIRLNISRNTLIALAISIVLHLLALLFLVPKIDFNPSPRATTLEVSLVPKLTAPDVAPISQPMPAPPVELPTPEPKVITKKLTSKPSKPKTNDFSVPEILTTPEPSPQQVPVSPKPQPQIPPDAATDMMAMVNQKRAQREVLEADAAQQNAAAAVAERGPSEEEKRDANIKRNFQNGTNGIFEITRLGSHSASFTFLGWTSSLSNARREFFEVEAANGQDVRLVMMRRMIELIRTHYQGDFDWESRRLNRTIVKSARVEDSAELEDFLMQEFFGQNYKSQ